MTIAVISKIFDANNPAITLQRDCRVYVSLCASAIIAVTSVRNTGQTCWTGLNAESCFVDTSNLVYIDGTDAVTEGTFESTKTGATLSYTNWAGNEPNNWDGVEHCVNMYAEDNGLWNDLNCDIPLPAVCEIERRKYTCTYQSS